MNINDILKKAIIATLNQGEPSYGDDPKQCMYRNGEGLKCAVGQLITDEYYDESLEQMPMRSDEIVNAVNLSLNVELTRHEIEMLSKVQHAHDAFTNPSILDYNPADSSFVELFILRLREYHAKGSLGDFDLEATITEWKASKK